jgi:hypothetical protein
MNLSRNQQYWLLHIIGWYGFFTVNEFILNDEVTPLGHLIFISVNPTIGIIITHIYRKRLLSYLQSKQSPMLPWNFILSGWIVVTLIFGAINTTIALIIFDINGHRLLKPDDVKVLIWLSFLLSTPWFTVYHTYKFSQMAIQRAIEATRLKELLHEAELENLKSQLNPHFLFNALNSIKALTITDPEMARDAITKLSDLLRLSLMFGKLETVFLEREMEIVEDYLSLEKMRFGQRLNYTLDISKDTKEMQIPPLTIQTLAENAIKHGISERKQGGEIEIKTYIKEKALTIQVKNSGVLKMKSSGIGLTNLQRRLKIMDPNSKFSIVQEDEDHVLATIYLNVK